MAQKPTLHDWTGRPVEAMLDRIQVDRSGIIRALYPENFHRGKAFFHGECFAPFAE
jgi:hypothetical protein